MVEYLRVFRHVGFFVFCVTEQPQRPRVDPGPFRKRRLIMYIGGGLVTLVIIVLVVLFLVRGF